MRSCITKAVKTRGACGCAVYESSIGASDVCEIIYPGIFPYQVLLCVWRDH